MIRNGLVKEILLTLAAAGDLMDSMSLKNQLRALYGADHKSSLTEAMSRVLTAGDIERKVEKGQVSYILTSQGWSKLHEKIPVLKFQSHKWDKLWRIIIFDIPECNRGTRQALRSKLIKLGFGQWQRSVYVTPFPLEGEISAYLQNHNLFPQAVCFTAKRTSLGDDKSLASQIWDLANINEKYIEIVNEIEYFGRQGKDGPTVNELWCKYKETLERDPHLPIELLPERWAANEARRRILMLTQHYAIA